MTTRNQEEWRALVARLKALPRETEWVEFKVNNKDPERIGKYISGLANAACEKQQDFAYLLWGIDNDTHEIVGTSFEPEAMKVENQPLSLWLRTLLSPEIGFEFHSIDLEEKHIIVLEIEAAYRQPVAFRKVAWIRDGSSLTELSKYPHKAARIFQTIGRDWSAEPVEGVGISALDPEALAFARRLFVEKHEHDVFVGEIAGWSDETFLNKAKLAVEGRPTKAALLLLGRPESAHWLAPSVAKITWNLLDKEGTSLDYYHFEPPLLLAVDRVFVKIRNMTLRTMPDGTLFPVEISQYDPWVFREAVHNAIAHQDYRLCKSIAISEFPDRIVIANAGAFLPGSVNAALDVQTRPRHYPNAALAEAMVELKMIDTIGSGIRRMFMTQRKRFMPMPDYDLSPDEVSVTLPGRILDPKYTQLLIRRSDLPLPDIIHLDRLQKGVRLDKATATELRRKGLVEGRYPNIFPAGEVAAAGEKIAEYVEAKGFDDDFYMHKILQFICPKGSATREEIEKIVSKHLSTTMTADQRRNKIGNLLSISMRRRNGWIASKRVQGKRIWFLTEAGVQECRKTNQKCRRTCPMQGKGLLSED